MPRPRKVPEGFADLPAEKPAGLSDDVWRMGKALGNVSLAGSIIEVSTGERAPKDESETTALLSAATDLERKAFARWRKMNESIGSKLAALRAEYAEMRSHVNHLSAVLDNPNVLVRDRETQDAKENPANPTPLPNVATPSNGATGTAPTKTDTVRGPSNSPTAPTTSGGSPVRS